MAVLNIQSVISAHTDNLACFAFARKINSRDLVTWICLWCTKESSPICAGYTPIVSAKAAFHSNSKCQHETQRAGVFVCVRRKKMKPKHIGEWHRMV